MRPNSTPDSCPPFPGHRLIRHPLHWMSSVTPAPPNQGPPPTTEGAPVQGNERPPPTSRPPGLKVSFKPAPLLSHGLFRRGSLTPASHRGLWDPQKPLGRDWCVSRVVAAAKGTTSVVTGLGKKACDTSRKISVFLQPCRLDSSGRPFCETRVQSKKQTNKKPQEVRLEAHIPFGQRGGDLGASALCVH